MSTKPVILPLHQVLFANFMNGHLAMIFLLQLMLLPEILLNRWRHAISASAGVALLVGIAVTSVCGYTSPPHLYRRTVTKILWEGCKGFIVLSTLKQHKWWWMIGEFAVDWVEIPAGSKGVFQNPEGVPLTVPEGQSFRLVYFDASQSSLHDDDDDEVDHRPTNPYGYPDQILGRDKPDDWEAPPPFNKDKNGRNLAKHHLWEV